MALIMVHNNIKVKKRERRVDGFSCSWSDIEFEIVDFGHHSSLT